MKVFGVGLHKTGTTTLSECLRTLGYDVCSEADSYPLRKDVHAGNYESCVSLAKQCQAMVDSPWNYAGMYRLLSVVFPESKFILTSRDVFAWQQSLERWITTGRGTPDGIDMIATLGEGVSRENTVANREAYDRHRCHAEGYFAAVGRSQDLLVVDWAAGSGWKELCEFLGRSIPPYTFPHMLRYDEGLRKYIHQPASELRKTTQ